MAASSQSGSSGRPETKMQEQHHSLSLRGRGGLSCKPRVCLGGHWELCHHRHPRATREPLGSCYCFPVSRCLSFSSTGARGVNWSRSSYSLGGKGGKPSDTPVTGKMTRCVVTYPCCGIAHLRGLVSTGASRINKDQAQKRTLSQKHTHRTCIREERAYRTHNAV